MYCDHDFYWHDVTTRKPHRCFACARELPKGTRMAVHEFKREGEFERQYWCETCQEYWECNMHPDDEVYEGELRREAPEEWELIRAEVEAE